MSCPNELLALATLGFQFQRIQLGTEEEARVLCLLSLLHVSFYVNLSLQSADSVAILLRPVKPKN